MTELAQVPFQAVRGAQLADGGWRFSVWTPELTPDQLNALTHVGSQGGWLVARPNPLTPEDIPLADAPVETGMKTPGQRLRAVLYKVWETTTSQTEAFETFYARVMGEIISRYKEKLS